jgi:hypothetical protein
MRERVAGRRAVMVGLLALAVGVAAVSFIQAAKLDYDFHHFYLDARHVWEHGRLNPDLDNPDPMRRRRLPFYLPAVPILIAPLTAGGPTLAAAVWAGLQTLSALAAVVLLATWAGQVRPRAGAAAVGVACALASPAIYEAARFNQLSFPVLALLLGAGLALQRGRPRLAGAAIGLAVVLKLLPALLLVWLALKRQWTALAGAIVTAAVAAVAPCVIVLGPAGTAAAHREWAELNLGGSAKQIMIDPALREHFIDHRNQSIAAVVSRLTWPEHPAAAPRQPVSLGRDAGVTVARGVALALAAALLAVTLRPWRRLSGAERLAEFSVCLIAMQVFSPLLRQYYLVWTLPALTALTLMSLPPAGDREARIGQAGLLIWLGGMLAWLSPTARLYGAHLLMLTLLGVLLLVRWQRQARARPH